MLADVVAGGQLQDVLAVEAGVELEVEAFQGFGGVEGAAEQALVADGQQAKSD